MIKNLTLSLLLVVLLGAGCSNGPAISKTTQSDFTPVNGSATVPGDQNSAEGPFQKRLKTAISYDGSTFTSSELLISDQAHAPDMVMTESGTIYLYYAGWIVGDRLQTSAVAISDDQGQTWTYKYLELENSGPIDRIEYPDVVLLEDGTFRMFFTGSNPQGIHMAESQDGINFGYKGAVFEQSDDIAINSTTHKIGDTWHMYAESAEGAERLWHLTSNDGISFSVYDLTSFPIDGATAQLPSNSIWITDRAYLFFSDTNGNVRSMWSKNGFDWYPNDQIYLTPSDEEAFIKDVSVLALDDKRYLMVYTTNIPN